MKKIFLLSITLCFAHVCFAQLKVVGNAAIGASPDSKGKLLLYNKSAVTDTIFGLRSTVWNTLNNGPSNPNKPMYGIYSINTNASYSALYGAYFKNTLSNPAQASPGPLYGVYVDNSNSTYSSTTYGVYVKNSTNNQSGTTYGVYSTNSIGNSSGYGAYFSVSGGSAGARCAGYFTGGKVIMTNAGGTIGLDVQGEVWSGGSKLTSDERLKTEIKPLSNEKDKLYLLQGKSYKKKTKSLASEEDSLAKNMEIIETPEYGYLAQELKEIFPDLVGQDSAGYYGVNYIGLIPVIVEALKDQRLEIEKQREQIKQLIKLVDVKAINEKVFEENGIESIPLLLQNTPNPFNQATEIGYFIPANVNSANIYIYDINGFQQKSISITERGKGVTVLQATVLRAGIYFYTLICDGEPVDTKQMILTR